MPHETVQIRTADGVCPAHVYRPVGDGPWPAVLVFHDGMGVRPALMEIAERVASAGYYALLPDLFYRIGGFTADPATLFTDPAQRADFTARVAPSASAPNVMRDMEAFLAHLGADPHVREGAVGITGYCMGGRLSFVAAGTFGDRVAASAAYHPSNLATDAPDSPHLLAPRITARVYVGAAMEDRGFDEAQQARLDRALTDAGVDHVVEQYHARHGWVPRDTPVHDPAEAERHWRTLFALLDGALRS
jgi:carboxymethylenebutenolidase